MSVSSLNFAVDGIGFSLLVQYEDREVQLTLPMATTFEQLHRLLSQHWPSAAINTLIQDGQERNACASIAPVRMGRSNLAVLGSDGADFAAAAATAPLALAVIPQATA